MVEIDEIDCKILRELIKNSRAKLKDLAEDCNVSINAIFKRIQHLKQSGLIKKATLFTNMGALGYEISATIGMNLNPDQELSVINLMRDKKLNLAAVSRSMGKFDLCIFVMAKNLEEIEDFKRDLILKGINKVSVNFWGKTHILYENVELKAAEC